ncbi:hypothetical protein [Noviherbaspirillum pedocola]|uniref:Uncharacterized protein n=1 Tax=Noviherbaspirillum pedocola TaxID=2801341 RepID=A0A934SUE4_9BURK|nr:hypothetical protein [Noviherbaspirillum pedocola]MBK4735892.1 hypothetical protein [Noviherbaspirillum pedocola]
MSAPTVCFRPTTDSLLVALEASKIYIRRVERQAADSDLIYLRSGRVLHIDYAKIPLVSVKLTDKPAQEGNIDIAAWTVKDGEAVASIVHSIEQI